MERRDYGQLKDLILYRSRWRQDSEWEEQINVVGCMLFS